VTAEDVFGVAEEDEGVVLVGIELEPGLAKNGGDEPERP
jgi:hypothetical protein